MALAGAGLRYVVAICVALLLAGCTYAISGTARPAAGLKPNPLTGDEAKPAAVELMRKAQTAKSLEGLLKSLRSSAKIEYQPGYAPAAKKG